MIALYEHPLSPYAQKVKILLLEKELPFESKRPSPLDFANPNSEFVSASPRGEVPILIDGATRLFDSTIIAQYLEEKYPAKPMLPATPEARARIRSVEETVDTIYEGITWGLGEIRYWGRADGALREALLSRAGQQLAGLHAWLERELGDQTFFGGAAFGYGDACMYPFVAGAKIFGFGPTPASKLGAWFTRALARPSVERCAKEVGDPAQWFTDLPGLLAQGLFKRQYRDHRLEWMIRSGGLEVVAKGIARNDVRFTYEPS